MDKKQVQERLAGTSAGEIVGWIGGMALFAVVLGFLALHSLNAFAFIFKDSQEYLAFLGFGMTGGAAIVYLVKLVFSQNATNLKKVVYFLMMMICGTGEVLTALFGMKLSAAETAQYIIPQATIDTFFTMVQGLAFLHFLAIVTELAGDTIFVMFSTIHLPWGRKNTEFSSPAPNTVLAAETKQLTLNPNGEHEETVNPTMGEM